MPNVTEVNGIPESRIGSEVQQVIDAGATKVECEKQSDGTWTIRAS